MAFNLANLPALWGGSSLGQAPVGTQATASSLDYQQTLSSILDEFSPFPAYSLVIGRCLDGLPFMLGLDNPRPGSILLVGDQHLEKHNILSTMSTSACRINGPGEVTWSLVSDSPNRYPDLVKSPHCQVVISPHDRAAGDLIIELASVVEQRRFGRERGSTHVVLVDDFRSFAPMLSDYRIYLNLKTLISKGPGCGIWPLISATTGDAHTEQGHLLRTFGTFIFEKNQPSGDRFIPPRSRNTTHAGNQADFNVIVGGRLIPITSLVA